MLKPHVMSPLWEKSTWDLLLVTTENKSSNYTHIPRLYGNADSKYKMHTREETFKSQDTNTPNRNKI